MGLGALLAVGTMSIIGALTEKALEYKGRDDIARNVSVVNKSVLGATVTVVMIHAIRTVSKLLTN